MSMIEENVNDNPRLRLAANIQRRRMQLRMSQEQLARQAGLGTGQTVSSIEQGKREVKAVELTAIAKALHCDWTDLLDGPDTDVPTVAWRKRPETGAEEDQARFLQLCEFYRMVEDWTRDHEELRLPSVRQSYGPPDYTWARSIAEDIRQQLNLGRFPAVSLLQTLEEGYGLKIFFVPNLRGSAASTCSPRFGGAIVLNATEVRWRRNFSLAHELFHLLTWTYLPPQEGDGICLWSKRTEQCADVFASTLLLPENALLASLGRHAEENRINYRGLVEVAEEFDVSVQAILWRLVSLKLLPQTRAEELQHVPELQREDRELLHSNSAPAQWPARFLRLLRTAYLQGEVSAGRVAEMLGQRLADVRQRLLEWEEDQVSAGEVVRLA